MLEIPLNSSPEQLFVIPLNGQNYDCRVFYNTREGTWSISFAQDGKDIVNGVALVGGVNILNQFNLPIDNMYVVNIEDPKLDAGPNNLGTAVKLIIVTQEELNG